MNWMQQFKQRVEQENPQSEPTPQAVSITVEASEQERESSPTPAPLVAATDPREVSEKKRKALPSPHQMRSAYQWLCSFDSEFRVRGRCKPEAKCQFLIDWLPDDLRQEFFLRGDLQWRDWNTCYTFPPERLQLEHLLDGLLGSGWRDMDETDLMRVARDHARLWHEQQDRDARIITSLIWELTGNHERQKELGFVVPWGYRRKEGCNDGTPERNPD